jgi:c-di-GMP-binding flagellar brake protein YcgR
MAKVLSDQSTKARKPAALKDNRYAERVSVNCRVTYRGEISSQPHNGEGLTKDVSLTGCKIVSNRPVTRGTLLTLTIALPDGQPPLRFFSAHVVWVSGAQFSVRFMHLSQDNRKRLQSFIWKNISHGVVEDRWARFRIA